MLFEGNPPTMISWFLNRKADPEEIRDLVIPIILEYFNSQPLLVYTVPMLRIFPRFLFRRCLFLAILTGWFADAQAIEVLNYDAALHDRFENDPSFIGSTFDWSGVGLSTDGRWVTMISDTYFITAEHFRPSGTVRFYYDNNPSGSFEDLTIDTLYGMEIGDAGSDIWLGRLTSPISASVTFYDILELGPVGTYTDYEGLSLYTVGIADGTGDTNFRVGTNVIDSGSVDFINDTGGGGVLNNWTYTFTYDTSSGTGESVVEIGDSGAPTFTVDGGVLKLVGFHSERADVGAIGPSNGDFSVDSLVGPYADTIAAAVPEPGTIALLGVAFGGGLFRLRRRHRA